MEHCGLHALSKQCSLTQYRYDAATSGRQTHRHLIRECKAFAPPPPEPLDICPQVARKLPSRTIASADVTLTLTFITTLNPYF